MTDLTTPLTDAGLPVPEEVEEYTRLSDTPVPGLDGVPPDSVPMDVWNYQRGFQAAQNLADAALAACIAQTVELKGELERITSVLNRSLEFLAPDNVLAKLHAAEAECDRLRHDNDKLRAGIWERAYSDDATCKHVNNLYAHCLACQVEQAEAEIAELRQTLEATTKTMLAILAADEPPMTTYCLICDESAQDCECWREERDDDTP